MKHSGSGQRRSACRYFCRLVAALLTAAVLLPVNMPVYAEMVHSLQMSRLTASSTLRRGGSGGWLYNLSCSDGWVLVGVNASAGSWLDRIQGVCSRVTTGGAWTGSLSNTGSAGGPGGSPTTRMCPSGYAINGFDGRAGDFIDQLIVVCSRLTSNGAIDTAQSIRLPAIGGSGGTAFTTTTCSQPARSIVGKAGAFVDSIEFACESASPIMTTAQIDSALAGATGILKNDSGANDVACDVRASRSGRVRIEPSNGLWNIGSSNELNNACDLLGFGVVTSQISYCSDFGTNIIGCARPGCMVVVPFGSGSGRNTLWAHEFGHTRALPHRDGSGNIMNSSTSINNGGTLINSSECGAYVNPVTAFFFSFLPGEEGESEDLSLDEFVSRTFVHGLPYERVIAYGPEAVPALVAILGDAGQKEKWSTAASMLAMIGDPVGVDAVIRFIEKTDAGNPASEIAWARRNAVLALGYAANSAGGKPLQYLVESLQPEAWKKRKVPGARGPQPRLIKTADDDVEIDEEISLDDELTEMAVIGLALSGRPEARKALENYAQAPGRSDHEKSLAAQALREHAEISRKGLRAYDRDRISRANERSDAAKQEAEYRKSARGKADGDIEFEKPVDPPLPDAADGNAGG